MVAARKGFTNIGLNEMKQYLQVDVGQKYMDYTKVQKGLGVIEVIH